MAGDRVDKAEACELKLVQAPWAWAIQNSAAIDAHWQERSAQNPNFFNGPIHLARSGLLAGGRLRATMTRTDFKSFLYWRDQGFPEAGAYDAFGSAILRSSDGAVMMCTQQPGHINEGSVYLPGGFIDERDVRDDGTIDIAASIAREVEEETYLTASEVRAKPGFYIVRHSHQISIGQEIVANIPAEQLKALILSRLAQDPDPELADIVIVRNLAEASQHNVPQYARLALSAVFGGA